MESGATPSIITIAGFTFIIFIAAIFGILTRPIGFLAAFWPANAVFLGLLLVRPEFRRPVFWAGGIIGLFLAGVVTSDPLTKNMWLTVTNLCGVAAGYATMRRLDSAHLRLELPTSMLFMFVASAVAAFASSTVGTLIGHWLLNVHYFNSSWEYWFTAEILNFVITLPLAMTVGRMKSKKLVKLLQPPANPERILPIIALLISIGVSLLVGGGGAIAFAVPALLWCSLTYSIPTNAILMLIYSAAMVILHASGHIVPIIPDIMVDSVVSFRLGITMLAVGPLTVASIRSSQLQLMRELQHAASTDNLTGALRRESFLSTARDALPAAQDISLLMIDIDHFKKVNDEYGHPVGDKVLAEIAHRMGENLREGEVFGRLGGEEFAVMIPNITSSESMVLANRLRERVQELEIELPNNGGYLKTSVSIGVAARPVTPELNMSSLLTSADAALYDAKHRGRNCVVLADN